jgi:hypothetical protein
MTANQDRTGLCTVDSFLVWTNIQMKSHCVTHINSCSGKLSFFYFYVCAGQACEVERQTLQPARSGTELARRNGFCASVPVMIMI